MRPKGSITGPLIIIAVGVLFLLHAISPQFAIADWIAEYWPYLLILWGVVALAEVSFRALRGAPIPTNGVSGGAWLVVVLISLLGLSLFHIHGQDGWWRHTDWGRGFDNALGEEHEYSLDGMQKAVGSAPHLILENFRGDAKITGTDGAILTLGGHKTVHAFKDDSANRTNAETPVEVVVDGKNVRIRCNQSRALYRTSVTTDLELTVPKGTSVEADGTTGDFEISSLAGDIALRSGNAGVRLQDLGGNVTVETRRSDVIRCTNVKGSVDVRGHGSDVELSKIEGLVSVNGDYTGTVSLRALSMPARVQNFHTDLQLKQIPGEVRLDRGSLSIQDAIGPLKLSAHSTDVSVEGVSDALDISVDRGDVDLKPARLPLGKIAVHTASGNIEASLPQGAAFALKATTDHGQVENEFGAALREQTSGRGARLEGAVGEGPNLDLMTGRGNITVRKSGEATPTSVALMKN